MANIGSAFLGDHPRTRIRLGSSSTSSSTPPSSPPPPPSGASTHPQSFPAELYESPPPSLPPSTAEQEPSVIVALDPAQALELRLRWLEALLFGTKHARAGQEAHKAVDARRGNTLVRSAAELRRRMDDVVGAHEGLRHFVEHYQHHAHLLTPAFALSGTLPAPPTYERMAPAELDALLAELEPDVRAADRDVREIEALDAKGVTSAGKLPDYEALMPRVEELIGKHAEDAKTAAQLEERVAALVQLYASQVDQLSEMFVEWDDVLREAEDKVARLERDKAERVRLGYEVDESEGVTF